MTGAGKKKEDDQSIDPQSFHGNASVKPMPFPWLTGGSIFQHTHPESPLWKEKTLLRVLG